MKICVIGHGTMGRGIAQAFLQNGDHVCLIGKKQESVRGAVVHIGIIFEKLVNNGILKLNPITNLDFSINYNSAKVSDIVIEAVPENLKLKNTVFKDLDKVCRRDTILASNTSSLSIKEIASGCKYKERIIGVHFMNPVHVLKLVEVVNTKKTSKIVQNKITNVLISMGRVPVVVKDSPGFVLNRLLIPYVNEAVKVYEKRIATKESIDAIMKLGANMPMGPLELADFIGLDVCYDILNVIYKKLGVHKPAPTFKKMIRQNQLGRKTKQGFYNY